MAETTAVKSGKLGGVKTTLKDAFVPDTKAGKIVAYATSGAALAGSFLLGRLSKKSASSKKN
jgi:hypothetical protein